MNPDDWHALAILSGIVGVVGLLLGLGASVYQECYSTLLGRCLAYYNPYADLVTPIFVLAVVGIAAALLSLTQESAERRHEEMLAVTMSRQSASASQQIAYCSGCGKSYPSDAKFCPVCGKPNILDSQ